MPAFPLSRGHRRRLVQLPVLLLPPLSTGARLRRQLPVYGLWREKLQGVPRPPQGHRRTQAGEGEVQASERTCSCKGMSSPTPAEVRRKVALLARGLTARGRARGCACFPDPSAQTHGKSCAEAVGSRRRPAAGVLELTASAHDGEMSLDEELTGFALGAGLLQH